MGFFEGGKVSFAFRASILYADAHDALQTSEPRPCKDTGKEIPVPPLPADLPPSLRGMILKMGSP